MIYSLRAFYAACILSDSLCTPPPWICLSSGVLLLSPRCWGRNWSPERWRKVSKVSELGNGRQTGCPHRMLPPGHTSPQRFVMSLGVPEGTVWHGRKSSGPGVWTPRLKNFGQVTFPLGTSVPLAISERLVSVSSGTLSVWLVHKWFWDKRKKWIKVDL